MKQTDSSPKIPRDTCQYTRKILLDSPDGSCNASLYHGLRFGDYQIEEKIGGGGMGSIYLAREISMQRFVALKVLHPAIAENHTTGLCRFTEEVRLLAGLEHPGLVRVYDAGELYGIRYFAMEAVMGSDLKKILGKQGPLPPLKILSIAEQTADLLAYAWQKVKLVHRDIKPANLMLNTENAVKVLDLGISRCCSGYIDPLHGKEGVVVGSPHYLAPEQAMDHANVDFRADMYSLGITMFHLLTGQVPFDGKNYREIICRQLGSPLPPLQEFRRDLCPEMIELVEKLTAKIPEERFESWEYFLAELQTVKVCQRQYEHSVEFEIGHSSFQQSGQQPKHLSSASAVFRSHATRKKWGILQTSFCLFLPGLLLLTAGIFCYKNDPDFPGKIKGISFFPPDPPHPEPSKTYQERRDQWLMQIQRQSYRYENNGEYRKALDCWTKNLQIPEEFQEDPAVLREIQSSILYLSRQLTGQDDNLEE